MRDPNGGGMADGVSKSQHCGPEKEKNESAGDPSPALRVSTISHPRYPMMIPQSWGQTGRGLIHSFSKHESAHHGPLSISTMEGQCLLGDSPSFVLYSDVLFFE